MNTEIETNTLEGIKSIALFVGYKEEDIQCEDWCGCNVITHCDFLDDSATEPYRPNESWDTLITAIAKFNELDGSPDFRRFPNDYYKIRQNLDNAVTTYNIAEAYKVFLTAIEWYNKHK